MKRHNYFKPETDVVELPSVDVLQMVISPGIISGGEGDDDDDIGDARRRHRAFEDDEEEEDDDY